MFGRGLQFRSRSVCPSGAREEPLTLSYQADGENSLPDGAEGEMGSERREESITSSQTKGERSLEDGDEFQG